MPAPHATPHSPPPAPQAGSSRTPSPPSPSSIHQVGSRQATRTRTRTRRNLSSSLSNSYRMPHFSQEEHPLSPHNLAQLGYHSFRCLGVPFHVKKRYTFLRELGIGAYGCVALCRDQVLDCNVAIKKVTRVFERDVLARRALREVAILRHIGICDNVTALLDFDATFIELSEIYLVLSASEADLSQIIRSGQALSDAHHQYFVAQILRGVRYMHAAKIVHRDLKPGNLLVNADCALRLCDFGLARAYADPSYGCEANDGGRFGPSRTTEVDQHALTREPSSSPNRARDGNGSQERAADISDERTAHLSRPFSPQSDLRLHTQRRDSKGKQRRLNYPGGPLTEYVATRWYRAPEVMLCFREGYGPELDMWSVGCILAELIGGQPIFPGKDYVDQITRINNVLGFPPDAVIDKIGSERAKTYIKSLPRMPAVPLQNLYPSASPEAVDLLSRLLTWDPAERLTADEALHHPWLKAYHESNARWQPPPAFDKFAEVEFIRSLREFQLGLQREADEVRQEIEALEVEEAEAQEAVNCYPIEEVAQPHQDDDQDQGQGDDKEHNEQEQARAGEALPPADHGDSEAEVEAGGDGNQSPADANGKPDAEHDVEHDDAQDGGHDAEQPQESCASSCGTSSRSCQLPVTLASSGSSGDLLSSTETSADEADPPSPRAFDEGCRIGSGTAQPEMQKEGVELQPASPFFRLGHEEEGRHLVKPLYGGETQGKLHAQLFQRHLTDDVFVPKELLQVAQGLVQHQIDSAAATQAKQTAAAVAAEASEQRRQWPLGSNGAPLLHNDDHAAADAADATRAGKVRSCTAGTANGSTTSGGGDRSAGSSAFQRSSATGSGGGQGASTPSLAQGLLDNLAIVPASGSSSSVAGHASQRYSKQLVLVQDGLLQSSAGFLGQLIQRSAEKAQPTLLVSVLRPPSTYLRPCDVRHVTVLDGNSYCQGYTEDRAQDDYDDDDDGVLDLGTCKRIAQAILAKLGRIHTQARLTIVIDSLDTIAQESADGIEGAYNLVRTLLGRMNVFARLVVGFQGDSAATSAALVSALSTPLVWGARSDGTAAGAATGTILTARLHAPAVMRYIYRNYGLRPPSSSAAIAKALASDSSAARSMEAAGSIFGGDNVDGAESGETEADVRFWDVLRNTASRGALGIPAYESGGGTGGWYTDGNIAADEVEGIFKSSSGHVAASSSSSSSRQSGAMPTSLYSDRISFEDIVGSATLDGDSGRNPRSNGWGFLELRYQAKSGKVHEELVGCVVESSSFGAQGKRLLLRPLDMADRRGQMQTQQRQPQPPQPRQAQPLLATPAIATGAASAAGSKAPASSGGDAHASMVSQLPFNLSETDSQRARREDVPLPYAFYQNGASASSNGGGDAVAGARGSTGKSTIFFEPEAGDDEDDEDPDDDLDL
ncbi:hypothetical protein ACQY0O_005149 [Thecaphora frezii]